MQKLAGTGLAGKRIAVAVKKGDVVLYGKYSGSDFKIEGDEYLILSSRDLLAVVK